jgi:FkbM family methyltransferase
LDGADVKPRETFAIHRDMLALGRGGLLADYDLWGLPAYRLGAMPAAPRVLDIGANVGLFAFFAGERWPGAHVMAFEPHPDTFEVLVANVQGRDVRCIPSAVVGDGRTAQRLFEGTTSGECSLREDLEDARGKRQNTAGPGYLVTCVDAVELPPCDVLKVDTEGCEVEILARYRHLAGVHVLLAEAHAVRGDVVGQLACIRTLGERYGLVLLDVRGTTARMLRR